MDIDGPKDDVEDDGLSNKLLDKSFYPIPLLLVHDYLNYTDFFIFIRSEEVGKGAIAVIAAMPITVGTPLIATAETAETPGKGVMAVIATMPVTAGTLLAATAETTATSGKRAIAVIITMLVMAGTPLAATAETAVTPGTRLDQISLSKGVGNTLGLKVRFYNNVIVIKESGDIDITALNDKATMPEATTLEVLQLVNQILECKRIIYP